MNLPKVTIGLVLYKGEEYLRYSLPSLINQDYPNIEFIFRDHSPYGKAYNYIRSEFPAIFEKATITKGPNKLHSGGHNELIRQMTGDYYFCCSFDMLYPTDFVSSIVREMEKAENAHFGSATCKLMIWDFDKKKPTNLIDSFGIGIKNHHFFYDIGQGEYDKAQFDDREEVFGASGALAIYRKKALDNITFKNDKGSIEYFDELIHYKNDVDLAYRLQWAGLPCLLIPDVKVYHDRQVGMKSKSPSLIVRMLRSRKSKAKWVKENSFFGHQVMLSKNFSRKFKLKTRLRTNLYQWATLAYASLFEPSLLKQFWKLKTYEKEIEAKTCAMPRKVKPEEIEKFMQ